MQYLGGFFCGVLLRSFFKSWGVSWKIIIVVHGYGCTLADYLSYIKMHAEYLKCDLALKQWFLASSSWVQVGNTAFSLFWRKRKVKEKDFLILVPSVAF